MLKAHQARFSRTTSIPLIVSMFLFGATFLQGCGGTQTPVSPEAPKAKSSSVKVEKVLINQQFGYELGYPVGWAEKKMEGFSGAVSRQNPFALAGVKVKNIGAKISLRDLLPALDSEMPKSLSNFKKLGQGFVNVNGKEALRYSYKFNQSGQETQQMQQIIIKDVNVYYFVFTASPADFEKLNEEFIAIANSFKLK